MYATGGTHNGDNRMIASRYRRVWALVETIAAEPGLTRDDLARRYHLCERQMQSDLNIIRHDMRLPLRRRQGYRFDGAGGPVPMADALMLVAVVRGAIRSGNLPAEGLRSLAERIPALVPPHIRPLISDLLRDRTLETLAEAMMRGQALTCRYAVSDMPLTRTVAATLTPELLVPVNGAWWVIGPGARTGSSVADLMLKVSRLSDITPVGATNKRTAA